MIITHELENILTTIAEKNKLHAKRLRNNLSLIPDEHTAELDSMLKIYLAYLQKTGKPLTEAIDNYLNMLLDFVDEQMKFFESYTYSNTSFDAVNKALYNNPQKMEYYMNGLLLSQFIWKHHLSLYFWFSKKITEYIPDVNSYLEIGGGHGLYANKAMQSFKNCSRFCMLDISPTSIEIARQFINNPKMQFVVSDIFDYDNTQKYDFITMGEVLEHVEDPVALLKRVASFLNPGGTLFITTPTNAPTIDHIWLFKNTTDILDVITKAGLKTHEYFEISSENKTVEESHEKRICVMFAALLKN
jgi:ubiquinone/menaquinone biosynthesis C-methylase UbiE